MTLSTRTPPIPPAGRREAGRLPVRARRAWEEKGLLALVGMGVEPGMADVFARYAAEHLFDEIEEIGVRDGANLEVHGYDFAPNFSSGRPSRSA